MMPDDLSRRDFLRRCAAAVLGPALPGVLADACKPAGRSIMDYPVPPSVLTDPVACNPYSYARRVRDIEDAIARLEADDA